METRKPVLKEGESCNEDIDCAFDLDCIDGRCQTPGGDKTGSTFEKIFMGPYYGQPRTSGKKRKRVKRINSQKKKKKSNRKKRKSTLRKKERSRRN